MNWGKSIVLAFVLFAGFIATLVTVCVRQDISLVASDYYKQELAYQQQINQIEQTARLQDKPIVSVEEGGMLKVSYAGLERVEGGVLELFRPSDASLDKHFGFRKTNEQSLYFSSLGLESGMYRARLRWTMDGQKYYLEQIIQL